MWWMTGLQWVTEWIDWLKRMIFQQWEACIEKCHKMTENASRLPKSLKKSKNGQTKKLKFKNYWILYIHTILRLYKS